MTEAERIEKPAEEIPQCIIDYNNAGYTSGAGKAIKFLMNRLSDMEFERVSHKAENSRLQQLIKEKELDNLKLSNDLADALEVRQGKGPTALSRLYNELKSAQELNRELKAELKTYLPEDCINGMERKFCHFRNGDGWKCKQCAE